MCETQAGKGSLAWDHPGNLGAIGVTGTSAANAAASNADLVIGVGTRLQDFTTGSRALLPEAARLVQVNVCAHDSAKHGALAITADARATVEALAQRLSGWKVEANWLATLRGAREAWDASWSDATGAVEGATPTDAQVLGAVWRKAPRDAVVVCAAGGLPGELHKLWRAHAPGGYHVEYGYSCMGYEIAGGLGVKMAEPQREVVVLVGDGSYLMMNSEIATSVMLGAKLLIVVLDNHGFGCIHRLQQGTGGRAFNNLLADSRRVELAQIDFAAHAASLGAHSRRVRGIAELETAIERARADPRTSVIVIETDPQASTAAGGAWWEVAVPEVSGREEIRKARAAYEARLRERDGDE